MFTSPRGAAYTVLGQVGEAVTSLRGPVDHAVLFRARDKDGKEDNLLSFTINAARFFAVHSNRAMRDEVPKLKAEGEAFSEKMRQGFEAAIDAVLQVECNRNSPRFFVTGNLAEASRIIENCYPPEANKMAAIQRHIVGLTMGRLQRVTAPQFADRRLFLVPAPKLLAAEAV